MVTVQSYGPDSVQVFWRGVSTVQVEAPVSGYKVGLRLVPLTACCKLSLTAFTFGACLQALHQMIHTVQFSS